MGLKTTVIQVAETLERSCRMYPDGKFPSVKRFENCAAKLREAVADFDAAMHGISEGPAIGNPEIEGTYTDSQADLLDKRSRRIH